MAKYKIGDYLLLLIPITYYLSIDVKDTINLDNVVYVRSIFQVTGLTLLADLGTGYQLKDNRYNIELNVTDHFIKKHYVGKL